MLEIWLAKLTRIVQGIISFTEDELAAFRGTNLYGATIDRRRLLEAEWKSCRDLLRTCKVELADLLTWYGRSSTLRAPMD